MPDKNEINLEDKIMSKVMSGEIKMKPKLYFILGSALSFIGMLGLMISAVFLTNLTLFMLRKRGPGIMRLAQMFDSFPMWIPFLALLLVILGALFLRRYEFSYKRNFRLVVLTLVLSVLLSAAIIDLLGLNEIWFKRGPMRGFYSNNQQRVVGKQLPYFTSY